MHIEIIEAFLVISETLSITKASEHLNLTQSTVSQQLKQLEEELGITLFIRSKGRRAIELTPKGIEFIPTAEKWKALWKETKSLKHSHSHRLITVAAVETFNSLLFAPFYRQQAEHETDPFKLDLRTLPSAQIYEGIERYDFDIGFVTLKRPNKNITLQLVHREKHFLVGRFGTETAVVDPKDLDPRNELVANWGPDFNAWHDYYFDAEIFPWIRTDTSSLAIHFLTHRNVWAILPACMVPLVKRFTDVQVYRLKDPPPERGCYKALHRHPPANKVETIRLFEKRLDDYLFTHGYHAV